MATKFCRQYSKCHKCKKGTCPTDVVVAGHEHVRDVPKCKECGTRYERPNVATMSAFSGAYEARTKGKGRKDTENKPATKQPLRGGGNKGDTVQAANDKLKQENAKLKQQLAKIEDGDDDKDDGEPETEDSTLMVMLNSTIAQNTKHLEKPGLPNATQEFFKQSLEEAKKQKAELQQKMDAAKPIACKVQRAQEAAKKAKQQLQNAMGKHEKAHADLQKQISMVQKLQKEKEECEAAAELAEKALAAFGNCQPAQQTTEQAPPLEVASLLQSFFAFMGPAAGLQVQQDQLDAAIASFQASRKDVQQPQQKPTEASAKEEAPDIHREPSAASASTSKASGDAKGTAGAAAESNTNMAVDEGKGGDKHKQQDEEAEFDAELAHQKHQKAMDEWMQDQPVQTKGQSQEEFAKLREAWFDKVPAHEQRVQQPKPKKPKLEG